MIYIYIKNIIYFYKLSVFNCLYIFFINYNYYRVSHNKYFRKI